MPNPYISAGKAITVAPPAAGCTRGLPIRIGDLVGLPVNDRAAGSTEPVEIWVFGTNRIPKVGGGGVAFGPGQLVYFDTATGLALEAPNATTFLAGVCTDPANDDAHQSVGLLFLPFGQAILEAVPSGGGGGVLDTDGVQSATFNSENHERVFYTLTIPANTVEIGDVLNLQYMVELLGPGGGGGATIRARRDNGLGAILVDLGSQNPLGLPGVLGIVFAHATVLDTGAGLAAARVYEDFNALDAVFDFTADVTIAFTCQFDTAHVNNNYRGLGAHLSKA